MRTWKEIRDMEPKKVRLWADVPDDFNPLGDVTYWVEGKLYDTDALISWGFEWRNKNRIWVDVLRKPDNA